MIRYFAITEPTVEQLRNVLNDLIEQGFGKDTVLIYEDSYEYRELTGLMYCPEDKAIRLYSDVD